MSVNGVPGAQAHVGRARAARRRRRARAPRRPRAPTMSGAVPHVTCGDSADGVDLDLAIERRALVGLAARATRRGRPSARRDGPPPTRTWSSSGAIMPALPAALDRHVADRHAALHRERLDRGAGVLDDVAGSARDAHLADRAEDQVLGRDARAELTDVVDPHRARLRLAERLGGEHVLDLARADAEGQRAEGAVRGGVRVAADDRHPRLGDAELGADHVDDALMLGAQRVDGDAELLAVLLQGLDLDARELVADARGDRRAVGRHVVVGRGQRAVGPAHGAPGQAQTVEGLRARDLVDEVEVDVDQVGRDLVGRPDLLEQVGGVGHLVI